MIFSPFEQFELSLYYPLIVEFSDNFALDLSITTLPLAFLFSMMIIFALLYKGTKRMVLIPRSWQIVVEELYSFIFDTMVEQAGRKGVPYFPLIFVIFMVILLSNLTGLFPYGFTITAQIIITFSLAFSLIVALTIIGFQKHGIKFLEIFFPRGIPAWLLPLLIVIEIMSYLIRPLSLSLRLFANMLAGHILLHIIASAAILAFSQFFLLGFLPWLFVVVFMVLEVGIAMLQAYVFVLLLSIYMYNSLYAHE